MQRNIQEWMLFAISDKRVRNSRIDETQEEVSLKRYNSVELCNDVERIGRFWCVLFYTIGVSRNMSLVRRICGARVSLAKHTLFLFLAGFIKNCIRNDILYIKNILERDLY